MVIVILFPGIIHIICVFVLLPKKAELEKRTIVQVVYLEDDLKNQAWGSGESEAEKRKSQYKSVLSRSLLGALRAQFYWDCETCT